MGNLDINGYNETFRAFADFAKIMTTGQGDENSIARLDTGVNIAEGALAGRTITASTTDSVRGFFKWFRSADDKAANNEVRKLFKDAIIDMFGGESKIPESVKDAMKLADYDKGKPLTARRIIAVKAAIDASGTKEARIGKLKLETFDSPEVKTAALGMGYTKGELSKLARATHFYAQATGLREMDAMHEIANPGSKANRLMQYGGRFLESAQNFANGLKLMDSFATWFQDVVDTMTPIHAQERDVRNFSSANTLTKLNIDSTLLKKGNIKGIEKFVFEELASNPAHDLSGNDPEKLFGFENNAAMRFVGRGYGESVLSTIANIPPAKRAVIYAAYDLFTKQAQNADDAYFQIQSGSEHRTQIETSNSAPFLARLLRNFDQLEAMHRKGTLTAQNVLNKFFPDIADKGNYDYKAINKYQTALTQLIYMEADEGNPYADLSAGVLQNTMNNCGTTIEETAAALRAGKMPPIPNMLCTGSVTINAFDGPTQGGRSLVAADADRPANYSINGGQQDILDKNSDNCGFGFTFPDGTRLVTNGGHKDNIPTVCNKIENLCGRVHAKQANSVMMMLSQSGMTPLRGGIPSLGVICNEHSAVEFSLSKDEKTGDVTIKYSSPEGLPFKFSWTATVDVDGNVKTTPMVAEKPLGDVSPADAKKAVNAAIKNLGVNLTKEGVNLAADLYAQHAKGMFQKNATVLANYIVGRMVSPLGLQEGELEGKVAKLANDIKGWADFKLGDSRLDEVGKRVADIANGHVKEKINDEHWFMGDPEHQAKNNMPHFPNVANQFWSDISSGSWNFNGDTVKLDPNLDANGVKEFNKNIVDQLNKTVDNSIQTQERRSVVKKVLTTLLHQGNFSELELLARKQSDLSALKGSELFVSKDMNGEFEQILTGSQKAMGLEISKDGKTATVTVSIAKNITCDGSTAESSKIGVALWAQKMTVDLTKDIPEVTNVTFSQQFEPGKVEISSERIDENLQIAKE